MRMSQYLLMIGLLSGAPPTVVSAQDVGNESAIVQVDGLSCPFCSYGLEKNLKKVPGVKHIDIDMKTGKVVIELRPGTEVSDDDLRQAVKKAGFTARSITRSRDP